MKEHYWLVSAQSWNIDHYDIFSMTIQHTENFVSKYALDSCKNAVSEKTNIKADKVIIVSVSYLGHMTAEEFNQ